MARKMKASNCPKAEVHAEFGFARLPDSRKYGVPDLPIWSPIPIPTSTAIYSSIIVGGGQSNLRMFIWLAQPIEHQIDSATTEADHA
jgi:hypothetical protein